MGGGGGCWDEVQGGTPILVTEILVVSFRVEIAGFGLFKGVWDGKSLYLPVQVSLRDFTKMP